MNFGNSWLNPRKKKDESTLTESSVFLQDLVDFILADLADVGPSSFNVEFLSGTDHPPPLITKRTVQDLVAFSLTGVVTQPEVDALHVCLVASPAKLFRPLLYTLS